MIQFPGQRVKKGKLHFLSGKIFWRMKFGDGSGVSNSSRGLDNFSMEYYAVKARASDGTPD